jgi:hypothetical protein
MPFRYLTIAAALTLAPLAPAAAESLRPIQAQSIDLGTLSGVAYYTAERDGFHVIATLAKRGDNATPVQVEAVLVPGQSLFVSAPREAGIPSEKFEISRKADTVVVRQANAEITN